MPIWLFLHVITIYMKTIPNIQQFDSFFESYYKGFKGLSAIQKKNFEIKKAHSLRVALLMEELAQKQELEEEISSLVYCTGLFHDLGRFPQFIKYNTFNDQVSVDHAALSVEELGKNGLAGMIGAEEAEWVGSAIFFHNKYEVPKNLPPQVQTLSKLLRDADKLDILEVICDYYEKKGKEPNHTLTWEMPGAYKISESMGREIQRKKQVPKDAVQNQLDIKVYQMSWVYDLNYREAFRILAKKRYIERIYQFLPKSEKIIEFYRGIKITIENRIS